MMKHHEGFLLKQGKIVKSWKKRYCVLDEGVLQYFKDSQHVAGRNALGKIVVSGRLCAREEDSNYPPYHNLFYIVNPQRTYLFSAASAADIDEWRNSLINNGAIWHDNKEDSTKSSPSKYYRSYVAEEGVFSSSTSKFLHNYRWAPKSFDSIRGKVFLIHGLYEHCGRYAELAEYLNRRGFIVLGLDLQGHGKTGTDAFWPSLQQIVTDVEEFVHSNYSPGLPNFIIGVKTGGLLSMLASLSESSNSDRWSGIIMLAPPLKVDESYNPVVLAFGKAIASLKVTHSLPIQKLPLDTMCRNPLVVQDYKEDPLNHHGKLSIGIGERILDGAKILRNQIEKVKVPFIAMQGTADTFVDPDGVSTFFNNAVNCKDKTIVLCKGLAHDLLHEPEKAQVMKFVSSWIELRLDLGLRKGEEPKPVDLHTEFADVKGMVPPVVFARQFEQ